MTTSTQRKAGPRAAAWVFVVLAALLLVLAAAAGRADAARLGPLTSAGLLGRSYAHGAITASFDATGASLSATTTNCSNPWTVSPGGAMQINAGGAVVSTTANATVMATTPLCVSTGPNVEAGGTLQAVNNNSVAFGVLVHAAPGGRPSTAAVYRSDIGGVRLQRISATGAVTVLGDVAGISSGTAPRHLQLSYVDGVYRAALNGTVRLTYTVPDATMRTDVEANRAVGLIAVSDTRTTFDHFQGYPR